MKKILIADDNLSLRSALHLLLGIIFPNVTITETEDKLSTLHAVTQVAPDYLILDWELPGMTGSNCIVEFYQLLPRMKIIVTSARPEVRDAAYKNHADAFICKMESPVRFVEVLDSLIHNEPGKFWG